MDMNSDCNFNTFQVSIPVGSDQLVNGKEYERLGIGASISFASLTEENLSEAIQKVLSKPSFKIRYKGVFYCALVHNTDSC